MSEYLVKNPATTLVHSFDWSELLAGETITTDLGWAAHPDTDAAAEVVIAAKASTASTTSAEVSGGLPGKAYLISSTIQTDTGREIQRSVLLRIANV